MIAAACLAALSAVLLVGPPASARMGRLEAGAGEPGRSRRLPAWGVIVPVAAMGGLAVFGLRVIGWAAAAGIALGTVGWLVLAHRRRERAASAAEQCARAARLLSSLLKAGQIPTTALVEAAEDCPVLAPAAAAARLGADVGDELARAARPPGQQGMALVAAAWKVSERSGAPVADVLATVAENLRRERQLGAVVEAELAAARTSGHIMAALPFLAVGLGFLAGTNPVAYLFSDPLGQLLVLAGVSLTALGVLWIDRLAQPKAAG